MKIMNGLHKTISGSAPDRKILMRGAAKIHTRTETATQKPADTFTAKPRKPSESCRIFLLRNSEK